MILSGWHSRGKHYLVDPFLAYGDGCPHGGRNLTEAKRKYQSGGRWHAASSRAPSMRSTTARPHDVGGRGGEGARRARGRVVHDVLHTSVHTNVLHTETCRERLFSFDSSRVYVLAPTPTPPPAARRRRARACSGANLSLSPCTHTRLSSNGFI